MHDDKDVSFSRVAIYTRVSTRDQTIENQTHELRAFCDQRGWIVTGEYSDEGFSGALDRGGRKGLDELMCHAAVGDFNRIVVWSVDRLGRSLKNLVNLLDELKTQKIAVYAHKQSIDTASATGMLMWNFLSIFSEFERELIRARVRAGLARAKRDGTKLGRPQISDVTRSKIVELRNSGMGMVRIGRTLGVGTSQVQRVVTSYSCLPDDRKQGSDVER